MKVTSERIEGCQVTLDIEIEPDEMEGARDKAYRRLVNKVAVPGFRKGKAPRALLERQMGKESFDAEALERLIPELYDQAIEQEKIEAIARPDIEMTQMDPPIFKATVPIRPTVELGDYRTIRVTPETVEITDEEIEESIEHLRHMHSTWDPVEREAQAGDLLTINVNGEVGEETVLDRTDSTYRIMEGSEMPVPGFPEQLIGMNIGDEKEFDLPFPEDHSSEELAGKPGHFKVSISAIKVENLPEVDDEFAMSLGEGIENVAQLRENVSSEMKAAKEREVKNRLENQVIEELIKLSKIEFPAIFTEQEIDQIVNDQLNRMGGMNLETYLGYRGITKEDLHNEVKPAAEKRVQSSLVLNKVYETEKIEVSDAEIDAEIERLLTNAGEHAEGMEKFFQTSEARNSLSARLLTQKTIDFLVEIATTDGATEDSDSAIETDDETRQPETEETTNDDTA